VVKRKLGHLWIKECNVPDCENDDKRFHYHRLNPRSQAMKGMEMTVSYAIGYIEAFDLLEKGQDWTDVPSKTYRKIMGDRYHHPAMFEELWKRYQNRVLHQEVVDLAANLNMEDLSPTRRKEIQNGLKRINQKLDRRSKR